MKRSKRRGRTAALRTGGGALLFGLAFLVLAGTDVFGQFGQGNRSINRAHQAVRERLQDDLARDVDIIFNNDSSERFVSNAETRVTGTGFATRNDGSRRNFYYDTRVNTRNGNVTSVRYDWRGNWSSGGRPGGPGGGNWNGDARQVARDAVINQIQIDYGQQATATIYTTDLYNIPGSDQGVRGRGQMRSSRGRMNFDYDVRVNNRQGRVEEGRITFQDGRTSYIGDNRPGGGFGRPPGGGFGRPSGGGGGFGGNRPNGSVRFRGTITNQNSGKVLGVAGASREDGANVVQWDYTREENQQWEVISIGRNEYAIVNRDSNRVLDLADTDVGRNGSNIQQYRWHGRDNQRWRLENAGGGLYRIINVASGKCLDVDEQSRDRGANIHQWQCGNERSQFWRIGN